MPLVPSLRLPSRRDAVVLRLTLPAFRRSPFLALALVSGTLLTAVLLSAAPVFTDAVATAGLQRELRVRGVALQDLQVNARTHEISRERRDALFEAADARLQARLGWLLGAPALSALTSQGRLDLDPDRPVDDFSPFGLFQYFDGYEQHVQIVEGVLPSTPVDASAIHVAIGRPAAETMAITVGDRIALIPPNTRDGRGPTPVVVDAIVEQQDPRGAFWLHSSIWFSAAAAGRQPPVVRMFVNEAALFDQAPSFAPGLTASYNWNYPVRVSALDAANAGDTATTIVALRSEIPAAVQRSSVLSPLDTMIRTYEQKRLFSGLPVIALLLQITGLALFLVWILGQSLAGRLASIFALLRSRGASRLQVFYAQASLGVIVALPPALVAPLFALLGVRALGRLPVFEDATAGGNLPAQLTPLAFAAALAAALLSVACTALPALFATRASVTAEQRELSRPPTQSALHRYYVDVLVLGAGLLLYFELRQGQSAVSRSILGDRNVDPLLLFAPGLLAAGVGLVLLRVLPLTAKLVGRAAAPLAGPGATLVLARLARSPGLYTRLGLLALMVATLGSLSATFGSTVSRSQDERAAYAVGADLRLQQLTGNLAADGSDVVAALAPVTSARVLPVEHTGVSLPRGTQASPSVELLAVDSDVAREVIPLRADFLTTPAAQFWDAVRGNRSLDPGRKLPGTPRFMRISLVAEPAQPNANAWLRLSDDGGRYANVLLGDLATNGWQTFEVDLAEGFRDFADVRFPLRLQAVFFSNLGQLTTDAGGAIWIDRIQARGDAKAAWVDVEDFEGQAQYQLLQTNLSTPDALDQSSEQQQSGSQAARFTWVASQSAAPRYIVFENYNAPVPAALSESLMSRLGVRVGDQVVISLGFDTIPVRIAASYRFFPTLDTTTDGSMVVELRHLIAAAQLVDSRDRTRPNEVWLVGAGVDRAAALEALSARKIRVGRLEDLADARDRIAGDPLLAAGAEGLFLIGLGAALWVAVIGTIASVAELIDRRRLEGAVLRSIGLSRGVLAGSWWLETALMLAIGSAGGIILGRLLGGTMLSFLAFDERGRDAVPPYEIVVNRAVLVSLVLVLVAGVLAIALAFSIVTRRLRIPSELRVVD